MNAFIIMAVALIVVMLLGPFVTIWSLNTLFGLDIAYTVWTWLAMFWLSMVTFGGVASAVNRNRD